MAPEADLRRFFHREGFEADDFGDIAAAFNVRRARTVTIFTAVLALLDQGEVGRARKMLQVEIFVTRLAGIRT